MKDSNERISLQVSFIIPFFPQDILFPLNC